DDGHWGLGLILRREDGRCVGVATKVHLGSNDVGLAEAVGLHEVLAWIKAMKLRKVIVEMDAECIVTAVHKQIFPRNHWGHVVRRCARDFDQDDQISL
ncbi:hypothetical protein A2U01_0064862, partial [Trifolium medium]|nr:hypothetical protein [Trifolium medium]